MPEKDCYVLDPNQKKHNFFHKNEIPSYDFVNIRGIVIAWCVDLIYSKSL